MVLTQAYLAEAHAAAGDWDASCGYVEQAREGLAAGVQSPWTEAVLVALVI